MKRLFYLLLLMPLTLLISCSKNDDLAQVDLTITLSGVTELNGNFYTVAGNDVSIENIFVKSLNGKDAAIVNVTYYFEGIPFLGYPGNPFWGTFSTESLTPGTYSLGITGQILEVGKTITNMACSYNLTIVEDETDLPQEAPEIGSYSKTIRLDAKD